MPRFAINLPRPMQASNDCLPHAAMNLGSARGVGTHPSPGMVSRIILQQQSDHWILYRQDANGGYVGDTTHGTLADAQAQAKREFGVEIKPDDLR